MWVPVEEAVVYGWRGYRLETDDLALAVAPDIGGRIISLTWRGRELLFVQDEHKGEHFDFSEVADIRKEKNRLGFRLWGGDKTWVAPQEAWWEAKPPLELDAGAYTTRIEGREIVMKSPACRETGLVIERRVSMSEDGVVFLTQRFTNMSNEPVRRGIWDVTQVLRPFDVYLCAAAEAVRGYPQEGDSVALKDKLVSERDGWACIPCREPMHFKFGARLSRGAILALRPIDSEEALGHLRQFSIDEGGAYLHEASAEVYNSPDMDYLEIEAHAPYIELAPGERVSHQQRWFFGCVPLGAGPEEAARILSDDTDVA